jgi:hypothetical protein
MELSPWIVAHFLRWVLLISHLSNGVPLADWYLQHFVSIIVAPAAIVGYFCMRILPLAVREWLGAWRAQRAAQFAWLVPTAILLHKLLTFHALSSVLYGHPISAIQYFFDIEKVMPLSYPFAGDPVRVWAQMSITGPFYAGIAYSLGAFTYSDEILRKIFSFERQEFDRQEEDRQDEDERPQDSETKT